MKSLLLRLLRSVPRDLLRDSAWTTVAKFAASALSLLLDAFLSRSLDQEAMGGWFLASKAVVIFALLGGLGVPVSIVRYGSTVGPNGQRRYALVNLFFQAHLLVLIASALLGLLYYFVIGPYLIHSVLKSGVLLACMAGVSLWIVGRGLQPLTAQCFRAMDNYRLASMFGPAMPLFIALPLVLAVARLRGGISLELVIYCMAGAIAISVLISATLILGHARRLTAAGAERMAALTLFAGSLPQLVSQFFQDFLSKVDVWIVGASGVTQGVAIYGAASKVILITSFFIIIRDTVLSSRIARLYSQGNIAGINQVIVQSARFTTLPALAVLGLLLVFAAAAMRIIFGVDYEPAQSALRYLVIGQMIVLLGGPAAIALQMTGNQRALMNVSLATSALGLGLALWLGRLIGHDGVAIAIMFACALQTVGGVYLAHRRTGIWTPLLVRSGVGR